MYPLKDLSRSFTTPHVNRLLLIVNIVVFAFLWLSDLSILPSNASVSIMLKDFVMIPDEIIAGQRLFTIFTSMFMHAGWIHLLGNMLYLYIFGGKIEETFGHVGYLAVYLSSGIVAALTHVISVFMFSPSELGTLVVGASGAISGVLGAYLVLYPKSKIITLAFFGFPLILPIPAVILLGFWFVMQWFYAIFNIFSISNIPTNIAYWSHIGGFIAGVIFALTIGLKRKKAREARSRF